MTSEAAYFANPLAGPTESRIQELEPSSDAASVEAARPAQPVEASDEYLLAQLRQANQGALALLFRRYARIVRTVASRILRDASEAEDLLQEVFLYIYRKAELFDPTRGTARSWIIQVTYHRAFDRRRHLTSRCFYRAADLEEDLLNIEEAATETAFYERTVEGTLGADVLRRIAGDLSSDQQRTLQLYFFEGHTFDEIAEHLGQKVGNVRNHYYRALERIRKLVFRPELGRK